MGTDNDAEEDTKSIWTIQDEEVTQESFEMIKARTMYQMVEEIGPNKQKLLFLTNGQADLLAKSEESLEKMFTALEIRKPKLLIYLAHSGGYATANTFLGPPDKHFGCPIGAINWGHKAGAFTSNDEAGRAEDLLDNFILNVVLPLAAQTQAVILCSGTKCCQLSCALDRCMMIQRSKYAVDQPFSVITMNAATANLYNNEDLNSNWRQVRRLSPVWSRRHKKITEVQSTYLYPDAKDDLIANAPCMVICDTIDSKKDIIGDKAPFMGFVSAVVRYLSRELPAITFKSGGSFHVGLEDAGLSEASSIRMVDSLQSGSPVVFLDTANRDIDESCHSAASRAELIEKSMRLHDARCERLLQAGTFDFHNCSALSFFHDVLFGNGYAAHGVQSIGRV